MEFQPEVKLCGLVQWLGGLDVSEPLEDRLFISAECQQPTRDRSRLSSKSIQTTFLPLAKLPSSRAALNVFPLS